MPQIIDNVALSERTQTPKAHPALAHLQGDPEQGKKSDGEKGQNNGYHRGLWGPLRGGKGNILFRGQLWVTRAHDLSKVY